MDGKNKDLWADRENLGGVYRDSRRRRQGMYQIRGYSADDTQMMDLVCILFLASLVKSGSGMDAILRNHSSGCVQLVTGLIQTRIGVLDDTGTEQGNPAVSESATV